MEFNWKGISWRTSQPWGQVHDNKEARADCWYDPTQVNINAQGQLILNIGVNPKTFNINGVPTMVKYGIGLVSSIQCFGYGLYEIRAKLPVGKGLWPAFWMYEKDRCIPEIDVFEGYSKTGRYYNTCLRPAAVQSCFHSEPELNLPRIPAQSPWFWNFNTNPSKGFNTYTLIWNENQMDFYINNKCVRRIKDNLILEYCRGRQMMVILNTHADWNFRHILEWDDNNPFVIDYFTYMG